MTTRPVVASFSRAAGGYRSHARVQEAMAAWLAEWLPGRRAGRALELGAGPGLFTRRLVPWSGTLTASDLSPEMCAVGRAAVPGVEWKVMAAEEPAAGPWDWIFSSSVIQWSSDPDALFAAWRRVLAPGGRVLAGLFVEGSLPELGALLEGWPLRWRTTAEWESHLRAAGFRAIRIAEEPRCFPHASARGFLGELHGVGAAPERRLNPSQLRRLLREYDRRFAESGGGVRATWRFLRLEAEVGR